MSLKILFNPCDGLGHINACIGLAQALQLRGHRIYFFTNKQMAGQYRDRYGFEEFILHNNNESIDTIESATDDDNDDDDHPIKNNKLMNVIIESGLLSDMSPFEKLDLYDRNKNPNIFTRTMSKQILNVHEQMLNIIDKLQPDLIIVDSMIVAPCILYGSYRWAFSWSANPILLYRSDRIPPMMSGYPSDNQNGWSVFREKFNKTFISSIRYYQNWLNEQLGYDRMIENSNDLPFISPYLNIYGYPKELDYNKMANLPDHFIRIDAFCRQSSSSDSSFELPEKFQRKNLESNVRLIYVSMGSFGSANLVLMKRLIDALAANSLHKFIISTGLYHQQIRLAENQWGQPYLPQTQILPLIDLVITHGGNNTVTETLMAGKPMIIMPLYTDQYDNAQRIQECGYGQRIDTHRFTSSEMNTMIDQILNDIEMLKRCEQTGIRIRQSETKLEACKRIEKLCLKETKEKD